MSVGAYDSPLRPQNGAPIRFTVPWKYGFKSGKSIARIEFTVRAACGLCMRGARNGAVFRRCMLLSPGSVYAGGDAVDTMG